MQGKRRAKQDDNITPGHEQPKRTCVTNLDKDAYLAHTRFVRIDMAKSR
jgi:hypothetical protein